MWSHHVFCVTCLTYYYSIVGISVRLNKYMDHVEEVPIPPKKMLGTCRNVYIVGVVYIIAMNLKM